MMRPSGGQRVFSGATLIEVGTDHRLADPDPLRRMLEACEIGRF
jgi:hypothetical protein